jgi:hypothetical protein
VELALAASQLRNKRAVAIATVDDIEGQLADLDPPREPQWSTTVRVRCQDRSRQARERVRVVRSGRHIRRAAGRRTCAATGEPVQAIGEQK